MGAELGVVAAGSEATARAGIEALQRGGTAVDAVVAAGLATSAAEPSLTSLAGGGVLVHSDGASGQVTFCDFSPNAPGLDGRASAERDFYPVMLQFGPALQEFHVGRASAAVPGGLRGLLFAQARWGRLGLAELVGPVCELLRAGVVLDDYQAACIELLGPILMGSADCRAIFAPEGRLLAAGERCANPALADTLERLAAVGLEAFLEDELHPAVLADFGPQAGGGIGPADLAAYRPELRPALERSYRGWRVFLPPPPAAGGTLIGLLLALLETAELGRLERGGPEHLWARAAAMRVVAEARAAPGDPLAPERLAAWRARYAELLARGPAGPRPPAPPARGSTTHISAIDAAGNAAGMTLSHGEGCGHTIGRTGIVMNNMMGEADLHPDGFFRLPAGARLPTMMSPAVLRGPDGTLCVLGSGGANRIRTAIAQVISNLVDFDLAPRAAVEAGRIHWEQGVLNAECFDLPRGRRSAEAIAVPGEDLQAFEAPHLFFGGVHLARRSADGTLAGGGDLRRSGAVLIA